MLKVTNISVFIFIHTLTLFLDCFFNMLKVTNISVFIFIHTLTHYVITRFLRFLEGFFLLYAVAILSLVLVRET